MTGALNWPSEALLWASNGQGLGFGEQWFWLWPPSARNWPSGALVLASNGQGLGASKPLVRELCVIVTAVSLGTASKVFRYCVIVTACIWSTLRWSSGCDAGSVGLYKSKADQCEDLACDSLAVREAVSGSCLA